MAETERKTFRPFRAQESGIAPLSDVAQQLTKRIERDHPDLLGYLVWTSDRLQALQGQVDRMLAEQGTEPDEVRPLIRRSVINQLTGLAPLDSLLLDDSVTEILVSGADDMMVERQGRLERVPSVFTTADEVVMLAQRLLARAGRDLNQETPMGDARLSDGSRVSAVLPPVSDRPALVVRRSPEHALTAEDLMAAGSLTREAWDYLSQAVGQRKSMVIAGGAGSGKTHLLRLLVGCIPDDERLVLIEDVRELNLHRPGVVSLEAHGRYTVHDLVVQALRLRPDRIIVGEVRSGEALDLVEAMGTGHHGSLSTVHAAGPGMETIWRLARAALRSGTPLSFEVLVAQMRTTVDLVIYLERHRSGQRRVAAIDEMVDGEPHPRFAWRGERLEAVTSYV